MHRAWWQVLGVETTRVGMENIPQQISVWKHPQETPVW